MKRNLSSALLTTLVAVATGCAAEAPGPVDEDPNPRPPEEPVPTSPEGRFVVQSDFDIATNLPGTVGNVARYFIQATDDPDDPTKFIVEKVLEALPAGTVRNTLQGAVPFVAGYLNQKLLEVAPDFVGKIVEVGDAFGQVTQHFGTVETLEVTAAGTAVKTVTGLKFNVDNVDINLPFKDYNIPEIKIENVRVTLEPTGRLTIQPHLVPMKYGAALKLAMNQAIIPMVDPQARSLEDILKKVVNCQKVGLYVWEALDIGTPSTFEGACNTGLKVGSDALYKAMDNIDVAALEFNLNGVARGVDRTADGRMDEIQAGMWTGELKYSGTPAPLANAKFFGTKM